MGKGRWWLGMERNDGRKVGMSRGMGMVIGKGRKEGMGRGKGVLVR